MGWPRGHGIIRAMRVGRNAGPFYVWNGRNSDRLEMSPIGESTRTGSKHYEAIRGVHRPSPSFGTAPPRWGEEIGWGGAGSWSRLGVSRPAACIPYQRIRPLPVRVLPVPVRDYGPTCDDGPSAATHHLWSLRGLANRVSLVSAFALFWALFSRIDFPGFLTLIFLGDFPDNGITPF